MSEKLQGNERKPADYVNTLDGIDTGAASMRKSDTTVFGQGGHVCQQPEDYDGALPDEEILYDLADLFKVFSDTTRIKILFALMNKGMCVADIAEVVGASQSAVSHQLRTLKSSRLVKFQRDGKNVIYSLSDDHVHTMLAQGMSHICE